jgi:hypothetical protein
MPRKINCWSRIVVVDIANDSVELLNSLDSLMGSGLRSRGRGNRVRIEEIGALISALQVARHGESRHKRVNLNTLDLKNSLVISALDGLGVLERVLTVKQLESLYKRKPLSPETREAINRAARHYMEQVRKHL